MSPLDAEVIRVMNEHADGLDAAGRHEEAKRWRVDMEATVNGERGVSRCP